MEKKNKRKVEFFRRVSVIAALASVLVTGPRWVAAEALADMLHAVRPKVEKNAEGVSEHELHENAGLHGNQKAKPLS